MTQFFLNNLFDLDNYSQAHLFQDCRYPWEALDRLNAFFTNFIGNAEEMDLPLGVYLVHPETIFLEEDCIIEPGAYIQGPCYLGKGTYVRHGAYIRGNVVTGNHCVIGHTTEIKNAILLNHVHASHFAYIGDSILGNYVNLGAGVKLANLRFDGKDISIQGDSQTFDTGLRKLGAIIGDHSQIGCNAVTNPGTVLGKNSRWYPCVNRGGIFEANSRITSGFPKEVVCSNQ